jgi:hypothetical protein
VRLGLVDAMDKGGVWSENREGKFRVEAQQTSPPCSSSLSLILASLPLSPFTPLSLKPLPLQHNQKTPPPDVANAVLDGVDGILLGQETLRGGYPIESVQTVVSICKQVRVFGASAFRAWAYSMCVACVCRVCAGATPKKHLLTRTLTPSPFVKPNQIDRPRRCLTTTTTLTT